VTEISPGINAFFSNKYPATQTLLRIPRETPGNSSVSEKETGKNPFRPEKGKNAVHTTRNATPGPQPEWSPRKIRGVLRGKHGNSPVTQIETGNSPVQKNFHSKQAPIQHNRGPYSR
jgi:hypothetical protein